MKTALAIGAAAIGLYAFYRLVETLRPAPVGVAAPTSSSGLTSTVDRYAGLVLEKAIDALSFDGVQWVDETDASALKFLMCSCYKQGEAGNDPSRVESAPCQAVQQMSPGLKCRGGDCDCNPTFQGNTVSYTSSDGIRRTATFRSKDFATQFVAFGSATPVGTAPKSSRVEAAAPGQLFAGRVRAPGAVGGGAWVAK